MQLLVGDVNPPPLTAGTAASDNNTVVFTRKNRHEFQELHAWLENVAAINRARGLLAPSAQRDEFTGGCLGHFDELATSTEQASTSEQRRPTSNLPGGGSIARVERTGLIAWLTRRRQAASRPPMQPGSPGSARFPVLEEAAGIGFAVIDVETTGLSAAHDRIVEIAVIHTDSSGRVTDEWTTLINPDRQVGATRIHRITAAEVRRAPRFADVVGELTARLAGRALVAHNARFDLAFLREEYARAGWAMPAGPHLCTLDASWTYLPSLSRRRLPDCCWALGIELTEAHSALGDARATAALLGSYLHPRRPPQDQHLRLPLHATGVSWPPIPRTAVAAELRDGNQALVEPAAPGTLATLLDALPLSSVLEEGVPTVAVAYVELLAEALEDGVLTEAEAASLADLAAIYALTRQQVDAAHRGLLLALAHKAVEDGKITRVERGDLLAAAVVLGYPDGIIKAVLDEAHTARTLHQNQACRPLPGQWQHGEPLRVSQRVAFTGGDDVERARLEGRAQAAGLRVTGMVSRHTAVLVTDGADPDTAKARTAREIGTRTVTPTVFAEMAAFVQPATFIVEAPLAPVKPNSVRHRRATPAPMSSAIDLSSVDPAAIRAWARQHGRPVGERGRLSAELVTAYRDAHSAATLES